MGGKVTLARVIVPKLMKIAGGDLTFADLCCGSGAISLSLLDAGAEKVYMVDMGPWGMFWEQLAAGTLDVKGLAYLASRAPQRGAALVEWLKEVGTQPVPDDPIPTWLLLQAASFRGKPVSWGDGSWSSLTFNLRDVSNPQPLVVLERCRRIMDLRDKIVAFHGNADDFNEQVGVAYVDPPYRKTTSYPAGDLNVAELAQRLSGQGIPVLVSDSRPVGGATRSRRIGGGRQGMAKAAGCKPHLEFLSYFKAAS